MGDQPLTGRAAAEAFTLYARLGETGVGFNARRVAAAVRTAPGRRLLALAMTVRRFGRMIRNARVSRHIRLARFRRRRGLVVASHGLSPGRPRLRWRVPQGDNGWIYVGDVGGPPFENGCRNWTGGR